MSPTGREHQYLKIRKKNIQLYPDVLIQSNLQAQFYKDNIFFSFGVFIKVK